MALEIADIQGMIVAGYNHLPDSAYLLLHLGDRAAARLWLAGVADRVTTADWTTPGGGVSRPEHAVNVALTHPGLERLGLAASALSTFPQEFQEGMAEATRARQLGDTGPSAPGAWEFGGEDTDSGRAVHAMLIVQGASGALDGLCDQERGLLAEADIEVLADERGFQSREAREHFGFRDGISNPEMQGSPKPSSPGEVLLKPGEFVLGYQNEYDLLPPTPAVTVADAAGGGLPAYPSREAADRDLRDLGRNGSYLVVRKLHQDVARFRRFVGDVAADEEDAELVAAKLVGRWRSGAPLVLAPDADDPQLALRNDFGFAATDVDGHKCPVTSHIRRTNPRDVLLGGPQSSQRSVNRHRLLRRGALYGDPLPAGVLEDDGAPRGILFLCFNADLRRQFEFVQQTWVDNPKFGGLYRDRDPLLGSNRDPDSVDGDGPWLATIPGRPIRRRLGDVPRFVTMRGGAYLFMPGVAALRFLASASPSASASA